MAAYSIGADQWFQQSKESRIFMTSALTTKRLIEAMTHDDQAREAEKKRESRKHSPTRRPARRGRR
jgi:hypothetical protein